MERTGLILLSILFILAGIYHFINPRLYKKIIPPLVPYPLFVVAFSGAAEIILGFGLLFRTTQIYSAWGLILLLIAVFPSNIYMAFSNRFNAIPRWMRILRLPLQFVLIWWAWLYTK
jgi:uncharacterized membrane protein